LDSYDAFKIIVCLAVIGLIGVISFNTFSGIFSDYGIVDAEDGGKKLVLYRGAVNGELVIPDDLNISEIGDSVFANKNITKIKSNTVKNISNNAFSGCSNLKTVDFPKLEKIGESAFQDCVNLTSFLGNPKISSIGNNAFTKIENNSLVPLSFDIEKYLKFKTVKNETFFGYVKV
jgi:hypothetical protein